MSGPTGAIQLESNACEQHPSLLGSYVGWGQEDAGHGRVLGGIVHTAGQCGATKKRHRHRHIDSQSHRHRGMAYHYHDRHRHRHDHLDRDVGGAGRRAGPPDRDQAVVGVAAVAVKDRAATPAPPDDGAGHLGHRDRQ